ncbi:hypothetical protein SYNPS1DRAFT_27544 [Syncephalis pseudoplumigaleata]|uniref:Uncharacterized protein n=1 Tax=Syncephalis pseudoplumigaleata TaxID=1712513 RepID=A0A4P9Z2X7_9FUNG|nr:hypothetical protein SYNPS1DRAFT_27544 [Syncephalis pseudoplumigaleata]|eukprot:RKP26776.1 hypothetical protein SYNPS1DRAFT_27544 [Syncephalis pseudoplumigaleata]
MSSTSSTPFLTVPNANETETRQLRRTFWVRLNRYARNEDILALASTDRAHAEALRPHCFKKLQCFTFQDMVIHNPFGLLHTICRGGLRKVVMKGVFAYHSVVSAASSHTGFSYLTTEIPSFLTSLIFNEVGLGSGLLKSIVDLLGLSLPFAWFQSALCKLQRLRQLSIYKRSRPQLPGIRRVLPRLVIHYITTKEFNNLVNRDLTCKDWSRIFWKQLSLLVTQFEQT